MNSTQCRLYYECWTQDDDVNVGSLVITNVLPSVGVNSGGGCACVWTTGMWKLTFAQFCFEHKTALKYKVF